MYLVTSFKTDTVHKSCQHAKKTDAVSQSQMLEEKPISNTRGVRCDPKRYNKQ